MTITEEHLQQYENDGYTLVRNLIPEDVVAAVRSRIMEVVKGRHEWGDTPFQVLDPEQFRREDGGLVPLGIQRPAKYEKVFEEMAEHANLKAAMAALLGGEVQLFTDQIGVKHGFLTNEQGGRSYYHQDSYYWHIDPSLGCNCWIPFDEVDRNAIALVIMPGSQLGWQLLEHEHYYDEPRFCSARTGQAFQRHRIPLEQIDPSNEIVFKMSPGDGLFFTNYTWHRSEPNRTGEDKGFYAIAYQLTKEAAEAKLAAQSPMPTSN